MKVCPNCGNKVEDASAFCQECGSKIENSNKVADIDIPGHIKKFEDSSFESKKLKAMIAFGYLIIFVQIVAILASWYHVKVINADRIILYPLLCVIIAFFAVFNLVNNEKSYIHSLIIAIASVLLFVFGIVFV